MTSREQKRKVLQQLHDMGFQAQEISIAIRENGYDLERCTDFLVSRQQNARPRLFVGQEVWIYSVDNEDWVPGNIVSITKQLVSIIFAGHDFRWLEKESDLFRIQDDKPEPFLNSSKISGTGVGQGGIPNNNSNNDNVDDNNNNNNHNSKSNNRHQANNGYNNGNNNNNNSNNPNHSNNNNNGNNNNNNNNNGNMQNGYQPPKNDEIDYHVKFTESVLGLELYSDEDGYNCIVGRCVSNIARANVTPGSQIVQVNDRWLANFRFEEIRDAVKQAAKSPPLNVNFRIKKSILSSMKPNQYNPNVNLNQPNMQQPPSYAAAQEEQNSRHLGINEKKPQQKQAADDALSGHSISHHEEKQWRPSKPINQPFVNEDDTFESHMSIEQAERLQVGDHIDNRDDVGRFLLASIVEKRGTKVKIHYEGWNSKWDKWYDYTQDLRKFARARSISRKPNTRFPQLKIRDYVDINPLERHPGWRPGQIRRMDKYSGQSQIVYKEEGQEFLYWAHLNNPDEIAPFMTKSAETIAKQQQAHQQQVQQQQQQQGDPPPYNNIQNGNSNNQNMRLNNNYSNSNTQNNGNYQNGYDMNQNNGVPNHNHKESMMSYSQSTSSKVRRPLPPTLQGRSLPPKPPRKGKVGY